MQKVCARHSDEAKAQAAAWASRFDENKRRVAKLMAAYYTSNPPYFGDLAHSILNEESFVPTEKQYKAMCENKYAQKVVALAKQDPLFDIGQMVMFRQVPVNRRCEGQLAIVLEYLPLIRSAAKGAKALKVLPIGQANPMETEERWLKRARV